jgi:hypothetical protein
MEFHHNSSKITKLLKNLEYVGKYSFCKSLLLKYSHPDFPNDLYPINELSEEYVAFHVPSKF